MKRKKRKGSVVFFMLFVFVSIILLILFAFAIPFMIEINTALYTAGEDILLNAEETWLPNIQDGNISAQLQDTFDSSQESIPDQISVLATFFQYGWIIIILVVMFIIYMQSRMTVETRIR